MTNSLLTRGISDGRLRSKVADARPGYGFDRIHHNALLGARLPRPGPLPPDWVQLRGLPLQVRDSG